MPPRNRSSYKYYRKMLLKNKGKSLCCTRCTVSIPIETFEKHFEGVHVPDLHVIHKACCWCFGTYRWDKGVPLDDESLNRHRIECFKRRLNDVPTPKVPEPVATESSETHVSFEPMDSSTSPLQTTCCRDWYDGEHFRPFQMHGRRRNAMWERQGYYADFNVDDPRLFRKEFPGQVAFEDTSGLGLWASNYAQKYIQWENTHVWYHVIIKQRAWLSFKCKMRHVVGQSVYILPHWCLCDGMQNKECAIDVIHHRHMIIVAAKSSAFGKYWKQVKMPWKKGDAPRLKGKTYIPIRDHRHLVNAVFYMSNVKSKCFGTKDSATGSHFNISIPMFNHAKLAFSTLFEGGLELQVLQYCKTKDVGTFFKHIREQKDSNRNKLFVTRYAHLSLEAKGCVIPFLPHMAPSRIRKRGPEEVKPINATWLYLLNNDIMEMDSNVPGLAEMDMLEWRTFQREKGNVMCDALDDYDYRLQPAQTKAYNTIRSGIDWNYQQLLLELEENKYWVEGLKRNKAELERNKAELEQKIMSMANESIKNREELKVTQKDNEDLKKELEVTQKELKVTQNDNEYLKKELEVTQKDNENLKKELKVTQKK